MRICLLFAFFFAIGSALQAQSFEVLLGTERVFIDAQFLKAIDAEKRWSFLSRTRATIEYDEETNSLFTGGYLIYASKSGLGATVLGRVVPGAFDVDAGISFFKVTGPWLIYALPSINIDKELYYSWFSILRYQPDLKNDWKIYSSLELFTAFVQIGHLSSVQRIRLGVDKRGYQFGLAVNLRESRDADTDINPGLFFRKVF